MTTALRYVRALAIALAVALGGCAILEKEVHNRGGYLDYVVDEHWVKADSKKMRALRAFAIQASLARIASVSSKNEEDRQLMARRLGVTTGRSQFVLQCAFYEDNPTGVPDAKTEPCFFFDSLMVDYSTALFDLAMIAFPVEDARKLLGLVSGGNIFDPVSAIEMLGSFLRLAREAMKYGRVVGAIYRDTVELEVQVWLSSPSQTQTRIPPAFQISEATVSNLRTIYDRGNDDLLAWQTEIAALRAAGLEPVPDKKFIYELAALISYMCGLITKDDDSLKSCRKDLPTLKPAANVTSSVWLKQFLRPGSAIAAVRRPRPAYVQLAPH